LVIHQIIPTLKKWTYIGNQIRNLSDLDDICAMTHLAIDQGNSFTKISVFRNGKMVFHSAIPDHDLNASLADALDQWSPDSCILSSVRKEMDDVLKSIEPRCKVLVLDHDTALPFSSHYETPATLGMDRIANTAGAIQRLGDASILVVDCGTCVTYSVIQNRTFLGGTIAPGLNMRYKALHHFTGKLPQLEPAQDIPSLLGTSRCRKGHNCRNRCHDWTIL
jgi:type III pantothenate kinase